MTLSSRRLVCRVLAVTVIVGLSVSLGGCAGIGPVTPVAVSDVTSVSGTWEGTVYLPGSERDDVTLTIRDDGSYEVVSKRGLAVSSGRGHIVISDGRLVIEDARGRGVGTVLRSPAGDVLVKVDMTLSDNSHLSAELWRTR
jgi:hypothetical protein